MSESVIQISELMHRGSTIWVMVDIVGVIVIVTVMKFLLPLVR